MYSKVGAQVVVGVVGVAAAGVVDEVAVLAGDKAAALFERWWTT
jgi:hypothetical protein